MKPDFKNYVKHGGVACPYCDSEYLEMAKEINIDIGIAWVSINCIDCGKEWINQFDLVSAVPNLKRYFPLTDNEGVSISFWEFEKMEEKEKQNVIEVFGLE